MADQRTWRAAFAAVLPPLVLAVVVFGLLRLAAVAPAWLASVTAEPQKLPAVGQEYDSLRQAERALGIDVLLPTYLPAELAWPPTTVRGDAGPPVTVIFLVLSADHNRSLVVTETELPLGAGSSPLLVGTPTVFAGTVAFAETNISPTGQVSSRVAWHRGDTVFELRGSYSLEELERVGASIPNSNRH